MRSVTARLHTMRKAQDFVCLPMSNGQIMIQSDKSIGVYDPATRKGRLCVKGSTFPHLSLYGFAYEYPEAFTTEVAAILPKPGGSTDLGGITVMHTVQVIGR